LDEGLFCDKDLLWSLASSKQGTPSAINQNIAHLILLPEISIEGLVALTTTSKTYKSWWFENFL
jgi:hypothetical protein